MKHELELIAKLLQRAGRIVKVSAESRSVRQIGEQISHLLTDLSTSAQNLCEAHVLPEISECAFRLEKYLRLHNEPCPELAERLFALADQVCPQRGDWPEVLTEKETVRFLRLDTKKGPHDPYQTLYRYRKQNLLKAVQLGRQVFYTKTELQKFIERKSEGNR